MTPQHCFPGKFLLRKKSICGSGLKLHSLLTLALDRMNGHLDGSDALPLGKQSLVPTNRILARPQNWSGRFKEEKKSRVLVRSRTTYLSTVAKHVAQYTIPTALFRLHPVPFQFR
jgi:hypothetical protein